MKKTIATIAIALISTTASADCKSDLADWQSYDKMIKVIEYTDNNTIIWINNIRNHTAIDIAHYGFNNFQAKKLVSDHGCKEVIWKKAYSNFGLPQYPRN